MNELGIKPLQDYVDEDNWNWETFIQVAKDANRDTNNDGQIDTWGLAKADVLDMALAANETDLVAGDKHNLDDPKTIEVFNFISRIATEQVGQTFGRRGLDGAESILRTGQCPDVSGGDV